MPGIKSLEAQQYYAHPRNLFWHFMAELFDFDFPAGYAQCIEQLLKRKIAVWDVLQHCQRPGSLDSDIHNDSIITNDFESFYHHHIHIHHVFFNGKKAEQVYRQKVLPHLPDNMQQIKIVALPSTSPANASITKQQKYQQWQQVRQVLNNN